MNVIIVGLGGGGSNLAYMLTKLPLDHEMHPNNAKLYLVDNDTIEPKNLQRQFFRRSFVGMNKAMAIGFEVAARIDDDKKDNVILLAKKIESPLDLLGIDRDTFCIAATDNMNSKRLLAKYFPNFLMMNCNKDFYEVKNKLDKEDLAAWDLGGGYSNDQTFLENMKCCMEVFEILLRKTYTTDVVIRKRFTHGKWVNVEGVLNDRA